MIDEKTINSVNKIVSILGDAASISVTYALGTNVKNILCSPKVKVTDYVIAAAVVGLNFKLCKYISDAKKELIEENYKILNSITEDNKEKIEYEKRI